eukprot:scaffold84441_cov45-Phaeocystis_antarctica.AAC.1
MRTNKLFKSAASCELPYFTDHAKCFKALSKACIEVTPGIHRNPLGPIPPSYRSATRPPMARPTCVPRPVERTWLGLGLGS